jgi:hypothetical protein
MKEEPNHCDRASDARIWMNLEAETVVHPRRSVIKNYGAYSVELLLPRRYDRDRVRSHPKTHLPCGHESTDRISRVTIDFATRRADRSPVSSHAASDWTPAIPILEMVPFGINTQMLRLALRIEQADA